MQGTVPGARPRGMAFVASGSSVRDNHISLSVRVEAKHPGRLKEDEAAPVRALGASQKSRH